MSTLKATGIAGLARVAWSTTSASGTSASSASTTSSTPNACQPSPRASASPSGPNAPVEPVPVQEQRREQRDAAGAGDPLAVAQPPHQAGAPAAARAASSVLRSSIAIVIGPTPRGTGVISARALGRRVEVDVADEAVVGAVDADVDHGRARLDPVALDHPRAADRGDEHVGAAADLRAGRACASGRRSRSRCARAASARPACRRGRSGRRRPPRRPRARRRSGRAAPCSPTGVHGRRPGRPLASRPGRDRREAVDVLGRVDQPGQPVAVDVLRRRELEQDPRDARVAVELGEQRLDLGLRRVGGAAGGRSPACRPRASPSACRRRRRRTRGPPPPAPSPARAARCPAATHAATSAATSRRTSSAIALPSMICGAHRARQSIRSGVEAEAEPVERAQPRPAPALARRRRARARAA